MPLETQSVGTVPYVANLHIGEYLIPTCNIDYIEGTWIHMKSGAILDFTGTSDESNFKQFCDKLRLRAGTITITKAAHDIIVHKGGE